MHEPISKNFWGLSPLLVFLALVIGNGVITHDFSSMPVLVAFFISAAYALLLNAKNRPYRFSEKIDIFCRGGGDKTIILLVFIFLLAGAFYAVTVDIGARDATVNWALNYVPASYLLPGLFVIACFVAFAMGTSMGTITAITPIGIGLATNLSIPVELAVGIVIGGAMFGDNLSFISDTTIAATRTQGVKLRDKFKANLLIVLPAAIVTVILLMFVEINGDAIVATKDYDFWLILPYLLIIISALLGVNVIMVLAIGIVSACIVGAVKGLFTFSSALLSIHKGMGWMQDMVAIALVIGGIVGLMTAYGGMQWLVETITKHMRTKKGAEFGTATLVSALDVATANNTIAIITAGPIVKKFAQEFAIDPRRTASLLDVFSCGFQGLLPYGGQLLVAASLAGVSPLSLSPYSWYPMLILLFASIAIVTGYPKFSEQSNTEQSSPEQTNSVQ